ncbi:MAG: 16S rRNA (cytidine(1402)-2'-O)-methyltransferase [Gammaproteobacteria bacterium]|nr:16S rRNA (cytidine(1402)-2'-O)-methyltransferase [Gammaproteobacteria bacterium]MBU2478215.1 16S rRNA (cytidine(1402)-2'-O)-methyltransferase [Gammaproteobacteria bacterium]
MGQLYVVATPIGNRADITERALQVLKSVACVLAEDTRHSGSLLRSLGIATPLQSLHEHNEQAQIEPLLARLRTGDDLALISDAGTPLISDPGFRIVQAARAAGVTVVPVPGPSALIAALSVAGLPTDRFVFEGFLSAKSMARRARLQALADEPRTLVFYESSHRIQETLADLAELFGTEREAVIARELTKAFEQVQGGSLAELNAWLAADSNHVRGEFVVLVAGAPAPVETDISAEAGRVLKLLLKEMPVKQAAAMAAEITGARKNALYQFALAWLGTQEKE